MINELIALRNTLMLIETKGESTKLMADCLKYTDQLISNIKNNQSTKEEEQHD